MQCSAHRLPGLLFNSSHKRHGKPGGPGPCANTSSDRIASWGQLKLIPDYLADLSNLSHCICFAIVLELGDPFRCLHASFLC
uniref:Uncharacterized protein n=1 Tax=Arundo donax TaxID=35708 RepID=A0A0A8Y4W3_ARUDO